MRYHEIEAWALAVIDRVAGAARFEDSRVELKGRHLPEPGRAARQLAALANAARGADVLWLVGVDQSEGLVGADAVDIAPWWDQAQGYFDGTAPMLTDVALTVQSKAALALHFATERAPFVVRSTRQDDDRLEVPWRDGTRTRSARRDELLRILVPQVNLPEFEVITGSASIREYSGGKNPARWDWTIGLELYAVVELDARLVFPDRLVRATLTASDEQVMNFDRARLVPPQVLPSGRGTGPRPRSEVNAAHQGTEQVVLTGPGPVRISAQTMTTPDAWRLADVTGVTARFEMVPVFGDEKAVLTVSLRRQELEDHEQRSRVIVRWDRG